MKKLIYICTAAALALACSNEEGENGYGLEKGELAFSGSVYQRTDGTLSRAGADDFFQSGYMIDVTLTTNYDSTPQNFQYSYQSGGIFRGSPAFYFSLDDSYITDLVAIWPSQDIRDEGLITDQRELENFRKADWLTAEASAQNIMPTEAPVPLFFERENTMIEFEIAGQNAEGIDIQSLVLELEVEGTDPTAFWAYCGDPNGNAMLILDETVSLSSTESYLIGRMSVTDNYTYTIIFPAVTLPLEKGKRYLVTLTAQGYDMDSFVYIGTFTQDENSGIGIPFTSPELDADGNFVVTQPEQLVTMSYLIRHYPHPSTYAWASATYVIADDMVLTEEYAELYIPIPRGDFSGSIRSEDGTELENLTYGDGQTLALYE
ncbi:MAG: fimbrillin family protein [Rikenellaceae bacterium]|nr:fimbrillin family protein [Rikenellaceae bacterium]